MNLTLNVLLSFYCVLLTANTLISYVFWRKSRHPLFKRSIIFWALYLGNFALQGIFQDLNLLLLLSFGSYTLVSLSFLSFCEQIFKKDKQFPYVPYISALLIVAGSIVWELTESFFYSATLIALATAIPQFISAHFLFINNTSKRADISLFAVLLVINGIHYMDFPILRFAGNGPIWGFSIALFILVLFSIFIPLFIVTEISDNYSSKLKDEVTNKTTELKEMWELNASLLSIVTHDLAAPLTVLQLASHQLLEDTRVDATVGKHHKKMKAALKTITEMLAETRDLQAFQSGKKTASLKKINPYWVIKEACHSFNDQLKNKNISIEVINNLTNDALVLADERILKNQILGNLISNAIKFSPENTTIHIGIRNDEQTVFIDIRDYGIGIPKEMIHKIFDFTAKTSRPGTNNETGTGLGLPLARVCAVLMDGKIDVNSAEDGVNHYPAGGTIFTIQLKKTS